MDKKEKKNINEESAEDLLHGMMEDIEVPDSLKPEAVETMLSERKKRKKKSWAKYTGMAAAACICLAVGITAFYRYGDSMNAGQSDVSDGDRVSASAASEEGVQIASAGDYDEIYDCINKQEKAAAYSRTESDLAVNGGTSTSSASSEASAVYSDTNVRQEGVGEADIVKTDGKSLFIVNGQKVSVVDISGKEMKKYSEIEIEENSDISEIYVENGKLLIFCTKTDYDESASGYYKSYTNTYVYDVSSPKHPDKIGTISQSGNYNTVRIRDGYAYVLSTFYIQKPAARAEIQEYIPEVNGILLDASDLYMPFGKLGSQYTVITAFSLEDPSRETDSKAVFGNSGICYVSTENIYITEACYNGDDSDVSRTLVRKISYKEGKLLGEAQTKVDGTIKDSFCIDEYKGYLRLVTVVEPVSGNRGIMPLQLFETKEETGQEKEVNTTSLYVLDDDLNVSGQISDLAPDENVYSARFMGNTAYFVTFRQVDPLFSADLSDPAQPKIIGELKIPGFSEYLHPYGDGLLLGVGMAVDEENVTTEGVKLSMFDISDPYDVKELSSYVIKDAYSTDIVYEYRAAFADVEKNLFGFTVYGDQAEYCIYTYDRTNGFSSVFSRELNFSGESVRGLYAGDQFYLVDGNTVEAFRLSDFEKIDDIVL